MSGNGNDQEELKATHSVLMSAAYFINGYCKEYNDDFMMCKRADQNPEKCALEGRKVTRCAIDLYINTTTTTIITTPLSTDNNYRIKKLTENCPDEFTEHWKCLSVKNNYYWKCREQEHAFNKCVFDKLGLKKVILDSRKDQVPIHMQSDRERMYK